MGEHEKKLFQERLDRVNTAIALGQPDRVPMFPFFSSVVQRMYGSSYRDLYYDYEAAGEAALQFYRDHPLCDVAFGPRCVSGRANELAGSTMIDWPGRPGTKVSDYSSHQVLENEYMTAEEYPEMLDDFTGFMLRKYIPRAYRNLTGTAGILFRPTVVLSTTFLSPLYHPAAVETLQRIAEIGAEDAKAAQVSGKYAAALTEMGFPPPFTGSAQAPFDILSDYFRTTVGTFTDLVENEDYVLKACDLFARQQIENLQYLKDAPLPVKRVFFPLHKGMDGFMSPRQYGEIYWKPLKKIVMALIDMGVTPYLYGEGPYNSRLEQLMDVPKGKVLYHFEEVDMKRAKETVGQVACICGSLSLVKMEFGTPQQVSDDVKRLLDDCAPGGGYLFDFSGCLENAKPENMDALFETMEQYGKY